MFQIMDKPSNKLTIENRFIRFIVFDLLLGLELSGFEMPSALSTTIGFVAIYLLITSIIGRCPIERMIRSLIGNRPE